MENEKYLKVSGKLASDFLGIAIRAMKEAKEMDGTPWGPTRNHALMEASVCHEVAANGLQLAIDAIKILSGDSQCISQITKPSSELEIVSGSIV